MIDTSTEAVTNLLDGVTPGPWNVEYKHGTTRLMMGDSCQMCNETYYPWVPANERDWHFIAAARDLVPALLAERDALKAERDEAIEGWHVIHPNITVQDAANVHEIKALIGSAEKVLHDIGELVANSEGVAGLHMNGEVADWESLLPGGSFGAWLYSVDGLRAALRAIAEGRA